MRGYSLLDLAYLSYANDITGIVVKLSLLIYLYGLDAYPI